MKRIEEWNQFSADVETHIQEYANAQYGDNGQDQATEYSREDCLKQVMKYMSRRNSNQREGQGDLDILKAAHYLAMAYFKGATTRS